MRKDVRVVLWLTALALEVVLISLVISAWNDLWIYGVAIIPLLTAFTFRRRFNLPQLSPTIVVTAVLSFCSIAGYGLNGILASGGGAGTSIFLQLDQKTMTRTVVLISVAATSALVAAAICQGLFKPPQFATATNGSETLAARPWLFLASAIPPIVVIFGNGIEDYLSRSYYLFSESGTLLGSLGTPLVIASTLLTGYLYAASSRGQRLFSVVVVFINASVLFSSSSRSLALVPIMLAVGYAVSGKMKHWWSIVIAGGISFLLLPLPLIFRGQPFQGLLPNIVTLWHLRPSEIDWSATLSNLLVTFPIVGASAYGGRPVSINDLLVSINPLPGDVVGWPEVSGHLRLNAYTPMAGLGEVGNLGIPVVIVFFGLLGVVLAWFERSIASSIQRREYIYSAVLLGLLALFSFQLIEYNLRSGIRLLMYAGGLEVTRRLVLLSHRDFSKSEPNAISRITSVPVRHAWVEEHN